MAALPPHGASYHTADLTFHSSPEVDPEAADTSQNGPSENVPPNTLQISHGTTHLRRGRPVLLIILLLSCLAFIANAYTVGRRW